MNKICECTSKSIEIQNEMTKFFENSEIIQKRRKHKHAHIHSLYLPVCESEFRWYHMFINHNSILSAAPTDLQL